MTNDKTPPPPHEVPQTREVECQALFPRWLIQDFTATSFIERISLIVNDATDKILRAEARLLDDPIYRNIIIDDPWILEVFTVRTDYGGYVRFPPGTKLQF